MYNLIKQRECASWSLQDCVCGVFGWQVIDSISPCSEYSPLGRGPVLAAELRKCTEKQLSAWWCVFCVSFCFLFFSLPITSMQSMSYTTHISLNHTITGHTSFVCFKFSFLSVFFPSRKCRATLSILRSGWVESIFTDRCAPYSSNTHEWLSSTSLCSPVNSYRSLSLSIEESNPVKVNVT